MNQIKSVIDGFIDFEGQSLAETLTTAILVLTGLVAFIAGWIASDLKYTVYIGLSGTVLAFLAVVPAWPFYNQNPLTWLAVQEEEKEEEEEEEEEDTKKER